MNGNSLESSSCKILLQQKHSKMYATHTLFQSGISDAYITHPELDYKTLDFAAKLDTKPHTSLAKHLLHVPQGWSWISTYSSLNYQSS